MQGALPSSHHPQGQGGLSLESSGSYFCHSSYLSLLLEISLSSPRHVQAKLLLDILTLLRTHTHNVSVLASLFWQQLLVPYLHIFHSLIFTTTAPHAVGLVHLPTRPFNERSNWAASNNAKEDNKITPSPSSSPDTVDMLVFQIAAVAATQCMVNEPKGVALAQTHKPYARNSRASFAPN